MTPWTAPAWPSPDTEYGQCLSNAIQSVRQCIEHLESEAAVASIPQHERQVLISDALMALDDMLIDALA